MRTIQASEAKTHFSRLLDEVERGETVAITRHGRVIARLEPAERERFQRAQAAAARIRAARIGRGPITVEEIISAGDEGRKR